MPSSFLTKKSAALLGIAAFGCTGLFFSNSAQAKTIALSKNYHIAKKLYCHIEAQLILKKAKKNYKEARRGHALYKMIHSKAAINKCTRISERVLVPAIEGQTFKEAFNDYEAGQMSKRSLRRLLVSLINRKKINSDDIYWQYEGWMRSQNSQPSQDLWVSLKNFGNFKESELPLKDFKIGITTWVPALPPRNLLTRDELYDLKISGKEDESQDTYDISSVGIVDKVGIFISPAELKKQIKQSCEDITQIPSWCTEVKTCVSPAKKKLPTYSDYLASISPDTVLEKLKKNYPACVVSNAANVEPTAQSDETQKDVSAPSAHSTAGNVQKAQVVSLVK